MQEVAWSPYSHVARGLTLKRYASFLFSLSLRARYPDDSPRKMVATLIC